MSWIEMSAMVLANASNGNPVVSTLTVILFSFLFNIIEALIEKLIFGEKFIHWLDPVFMVGFIAYAAYSVWACAIYNSKD